MISFYTKLSLVFITAFSIAAYVYNILFFGNSTTGDFLSHVNISESEGFPFSLSYPRVLHSILHSFSLTTGVDIIAVWHVFSFLLLFGFLLTTYCFLKSKLGDQQSFVGILILLLFSRFIVLYISAVYSYLMGMIFIFITIMVIEKKPLSISLLLGLVIFFLHKSVFFLWMIIFSYFAVKERKYHYFLPVFVGLLLILTLFPFYINYLDDALHFASFTNIDIIRIANIGGMVSLLFVTCFALGIRHFKKPTDRFIILLAVLFFILSILMRNNNYMDRVMISFVILSLPVVTKGFMILYEQGKKELVGLSAIVAFVWAIKTLSDLLVLTAPPNNFFATIPPYILAMMGSLAYTVYALLHYKKNKDLRFTTLLIIVVVFWSSIMVVPV